MSGTTRAYHRAAEVRLGPAHLPEGASPTRPHIDILTVNITSWSDWAQDYMFTTAWDVALVAETHWHPEAVADHIRRLL